MFAASLWLLEAAVLLYHWEKGRAVNKDISNINLHSLLPLIVFVWVFFVSHTSSYWVLVGHQFFWGTRFYSCNHLYPSSVNWWTLTLFSLQVGRKVCDKIPSWKNSLVPRHGFTLWTLRSSMFSTPRLCRPPLPRQICSPSLWPLSIIKLWNKGSFLFQSKLRWSLPLQSPGNSYFNIWHFI